MSLAARIDGLIGLFSPKKQLEREFARHQVDQVRRLPQALRGSYVGAKKDRLGNDWTDVLGSADAALVDDLPFLRQRTRELLRNDAIASSIRRVLVDNIVGQGLTVQSRVDAERLGITEDQATAFQESAEAAFDRAIPHLDARGLGDWFGLQRLACSQIITDGEAFARTIMVPGDGNRPVESAVELIEADRIDDPMGLRSADPEEAKRTRMGVVLGARGQPLAYWVQEQHPGDDRFATFRNRTFRRLRVWRDGQRVFLHVFHVKRPGQTRGEPMFAPVLDDLRHLSQGEFAELVAMRIRAVFSAFVYRESPFDAITGMTDATVNDQRLTHLEPGRIEYLKGDERVTFGDAQRPGTTFAPYVQHVIRRIGCAFGLPLELVLCDFSKTTFTSGRMANIEASRPIRCTRRLLTSRFCQPVWAWRLSEAALRGELELPPGADFFADRDLWTASIWSDPARESVDPVKSAQSSKTRLEIGTSSLAQECALEDKDWEEVQDQRLREELRERERREALGLTAAAVPGMDAGEEGEEEEDGDESDDEQQDEQLVGVGEDEEQ